MRPSLESSCFEIVVIASSLGGIKALKRIFAHIPADFPVPIVISQHLEKHSPRLLAQILSQQCNLPVNWAVTGSGLEPGRVYLAPPDCHTVVDSDRKLSLLDTPPVNFVRPSADLLFSSAAKVFGARTIGLILTGRGKDGAAGAGEIKRAGGRILVQDPNTCAARQMPRAALSSRAVDFVLPLEGLASALIALCMVPGADRFFSVPPLYTAHLAQMDPLFQTLLE